MDISKFLNGTFDDGGFSNGFDNVELGRNKQTAEATKDKNFRKVLYKRKGCNYTTNAKETRMLTSLQIHGRRKSSRQIQHITVRAICEDLEEFDELNDNADENENRFNTSNSNLKSKKSAPSKQPAKNKSRREKLNEYLENKKLINDQNRKVEKYKPAFKAGLPQRLLADNVFSTKVSNSQKVIPPKRSALVVPNNKVTNKKEEAAGQVNKKQLVTSIPQLIITSPISKEEETPALCTKISRRSFAPNNFVFKPIINLPQVSQSPVLPHSDDEVLETARSQSHAIQELRNSESARNVNGKTPEEFNSKTATDKAWNLEGDFRVDDSEVGKQEVSLPAVNDGLTISEPKPILISNQKPSVIFVPLDEEKLSTGGTIDSEPSVDVASDIVNQLIEFILREISATLSKKEQNVEFQHLDKTNGTNDVCENEVERNTDEKQISTNGGVDCQSDNACCSHVDVEILNDAKVKYTRHPELSEVVVNKPAVKIFELKSPRRIYGAKGSELLTDSTKTPTFKSVLGLWRVKDLNDSLK